MSFEVSIRKDIRRKISIKYGKDNNKICVSSEKREQAANLVSIVKC